MISASTHWTPKHKNKTKIRKYPVQMFPWAKIDTHTTKINLHNVMTIMTNGRSFCPTLADDRLSLLDNHLLIILHSLHSGHFPADKKLMILVWFSAFFYIIIIIIGFYQISELADRWNWNKTARKPKLNIDNDNSLNSM